MSRVTQTASATDPAEAFSLGDSAYPGSPAPTIEELAATAREVRRHIVRMTHAAGSGHPGGSLSAVEILVALYWRVLRHNPRQPDWPDRDRFIMSKGHASPVLYAVLAETGYFDRAELPTFRQLGSILQGHPDKNFTPGLEAQSGSLGQGLSVGLGMALAGRLDRRPYRVYVLLGDGECDEGQVWEAAMAAAHFKLDTITAIVDRNRIQNDGFVADIMELEPFTDKWRAFGWEVIEIDGHDLKQVLHALDRAQQVPGRPCVIIAHTVKGKGVSFMENNPEFHGKAPSGDQLTTALDELAERSA